MALIASFVVGANGASTLGGKSSPLSTPADRNRFLARHRSAAAFIIGKHSAAIESYSASAVPIFVFTRNSDPLTFSHPLMEQVVVNQHNLVEIAKSLVDRTAGDIVVEAGATLLNALVDAGVVELFELSISPINGDGDFLNISTLLKNFQWDEELADDGTRLLQGRYKGDSAHR
jgi:dihydrofolate reductase